MHDLPTKESAMIRTNTTIIIAKYTLTGIVFIDRVVRDNLHRASQDAQLIYPKTKGYVHLFPGDPRIAAAWQAMLAGGHHG
jgi:hypothetical protein